MIPFVMGLVIGVAFGFVVCAVLSASRRNDDIDEFAQEKTGEKDVR